MNTIGSLVDLLTLEKLEVNLFRGQNYITPWRRIFGGQVLGQALGAAYETVEPDRVAHSLHGYFILAGDVDVPVVYQVDTIRDGGSFTTRRVTAIQHGRPIFVMAASFQLVQDGFDHQAGMPDVPDPENLTNFVEQAKAIKESSPSIYNRIMSGYQKSFEFRSVGNIFDVSETAQTDRQIWMKTTGKIELSQSLQHQVLAYISDVNLLIAAVQPYRNEENINKFFIASLDHAMWFHRDFDVNDWLLYDINSPSASNSRGLGYGRIFTKDGALASTVMQEGLMRIKR